MNRPLIYGYAVVRYKESKSDLRHVFSRRMVTKMREIYQSFFANATPALTHP